VTVNLQPVPNSSVQFLGAILVDPSPSSVKLDMLSPRGDDGGEVDDDADSSSSVSTDDDERPSKMYIIEVRAVFICVCL
jgi:hypothetical protein